MRSIVSRDNDERTAGICDPGAKERVSGITLGSVRLNPDAMGVAARQSQPVNGH